MERSRAKRDSCITADDYGGYLKKSINGQVIEKVRMSDIVYQYASLSREGVKTENSCKKVEKIQIINSNVGI